jgi:molecular chaperone DnaK
MPAVQEAIRKFLGKDSHKGINPDECVAIGAAIQAGVLAGEVKDVLLLDITPLSLGIETLGGVFTKLIERNTTIPTSKAQIFSTASDGQTTVEIHVIQGERAMAADNKTLGRFTLTGMPPAPRGVPQIEVKFDIDVNGIVSVSAKDMGTGKEQSMTITATTKLDETDINRMVQEAEQHATDDKERKEAVEIRNQADSLVYQAEKTIKDFSDKADAASIEKVQSATDELKEALQGTDNELVKTKLEALTGPLYELTTAMYQKTSEEQAAAGAAEESAAGQEAQDKDNDNVVDADYEVKEDKEDK